MRIFTICSVVVGSFISLFGGEWTEETLKKMTLEEKIGQLIIVPVCPLRDDFRHRADVHEALQKYGIGGIIIKQGTLEQQFKTIQDVQSQSTIPLLVVADAEWGLTMRASDAIRFPKNMTLGALTNPSIIENMGHEVGCQLHALGVHMNLAPVVDVNSNPLNPIIRMRSFGDDPHQVAARAKRFARGLQSAGVLGCAKHFPGHGDTSVDSHRALPFIERTLSQLKNIELIPFQALIDDGIAAVMSGHIVIAALDTLPASLSSICMTTLIQKKMGFRGLIMTDALNMEGLAANYSTEDVAKFALLAGHDLLLYGDHIAPRIDDILEKKVPAACETIKQAVLSGEISEAELDRRVRKILETKEKLGLPLQRGPSSLATGVFHTESAKKLADTLYRQAITIVCDHRSLLPISRHVIVDDQGRDFAARLQKRAMILTENAPCVLVTIPDLRTQEDQQKITTQLKNWTQQGKEIIAIIFGSPYSTFDYRHWAYPYCQLYQWPYWRGKTSDFRRSTESRSNQLSFLSCSLIYRKRYG